MFFCDSLFFATTGKQNKSALHTFNDLSLDFLTSYGLKLPRTTFYLYTQHDGDDLHTGNRSEKLSKGTT